MIYLKPLGNDCARRAPSLLLGEQISDVVRSEAATVLDAPRAPRLGSGAGQILRALRVGFLPSRQHGLDEAGVLARPAHNLGAVAGRVFPAPFPRPASLNSRAPGKPPAMVRGGADHALAARRVAQRIMAVAAGGSGRVARLSEGARGNARRMLRRFRHAAQAVLARAGAADARLRRALADMAVTARLAGRVEPLAGHQRRKPFGDRSHAFTDFIPVKVYGRSLQASLAF